jgi:hypothetical protein
MEKVLFVCFAHSLTPDQKEGWDEIIELKTANPELWAWVCNVPPTATLSEIISKVDELLDNVLHTTATHFYCAGEPTLAMWANIGVQENIYGLTPVVSTTERVSQDIAQADGSVRKVSTFKHVQWRALFRDDAFGDYDTQSDTLVP